MKQERYSKSNKLLERSLKSVPLGSQTFSKSLTAFPRGAAPFFASKGKGAYIWDVDDNMYVDYVNGLASINLGYCDPDVTEAVRKQLENGVTFSLATELEVELSEKIIELVPSAEMVRFGKNGSDATSGAIRLARAFTGREVIAVCGYHGWHDWYIGSTTRDLGVPSSVKALTVKFKYNDIGSLTKIFAENPGKIAAVILEPMNTEFPKDGFLEQVKEIAHEHGALLIFDETITGFRYALGGAQEYFKVTPDLTTLGKGIANGYPLSAVVGRRDIMKLMEDIFFSSTFGGETLSLSASLATLKKLQKCKVTDTMAQVGEGLLSKVRGLISKHGIEGFVDISGHPSWTFLNIKPFAGYTTHQLKTLYLQECFKRGLLVLGTHNLTFSHKETEINKLLSVYDEVFPLLKRAVDEKNVQELYEGEELKPLFQTR